MVAFVNFYDVNALTVASSSYQHDVTEHGVGESCDSWLQLAVLIGLLKSIFDSLGKVPSCTIIIYIAI